MRIHQISVAAAAAAAIVLPVMAVAAPAASAAPVPAVRHCTKPPGPWSLHTQALTIRSRASTSGVALGILYRGQHWRVNSWTTTESWVNITDLTTNVTGWVSGTYFNRIHYTCLT